MLRNKIITLCVDTFLSIFIGSKDNKTSKFFEGWLAMICYNPLWETMRKRDISTYVLINNNINPRTINNLKHNKSITMYTLEKLCDILSCSPNDVVRFIK